MAGLDGGCLTPWSNAHLLVIGQDIDLSDHIKKITFKPNPSNAAVYQDLTINRMVVQTTQEKRITKYEYDTSAAIVMYGHVCYPKTTIIPGDNAQLYGYIVEDRKSGTTPIQFFNAQNMQVTGRSRPTP